MSQERGQRPPSSKKSDVQAHIIEKEARVLADEKMNIKKAKRGFKKD